MPSRQLQYYVVSGGERTLRGCNFFVLCRCVKMFCLNICRKTGIDLCVVTGIQPRRADHTIPEFVVMTPLRKYVFFLLSLF